MCACVRVYIYVQYRVYISWPPPSHWNMVGRSEKVGVSWRDGENQDGGEADGRGGGGVEVGRKERLKKHRK